MCLAPTHAWKSETWDEFDSGDVLEVEFELDCLLSRGEYTLTVATQHFDGRSQDWLDEVVDFNVIDTKDVAGVLNLNTRVRHRRIARQPADSFQEQVTS